MTISSPTFTRLQTGVTSADDLRVRNPVNAALTWLSGDLVTQLNTHFGAVSNSISIAIAAFSNSNSIQIANQISVYASTRPTFSANKNNVSQVSISAADTKITFGTEAWDIGSHYASSTWTPAAGKYRISAQLQYLNTNGVDAEIVYCRLYKNGSVHKENFIYRNGATSQALPAVNVLVEANGTDTFEIYGQKSGAGAGDIGGSASDTWFEGEAIS